MESILEVGGGSKIENLPRITEEIEKPPSKRIKTEETSLHTSINTTERGFRIYMAEG
jgi:hypothetical protein